MHASGIRWRGVGAFATIMWLGGFVVERVWAEIQFTDRRIKANWIEYPSPGGTSGEMRGYLVSPVGRGPFPAVLVMHENRGLNPYIQDVARRFAVAESFAPPG